MERDHKAYIETFTGKKFWPLQPLASEIDLIDMVHAVSLECRYGGHVKHMWSVGQHLLAVLQYLRMGRHSTYIQFLGVTHDLEEGYLKDIPKPIKDCMPEFERAGKVLQDMIWHEYFGIRKPTEQELAILKRADREVLYCEAHYLEVNKTRWIPHYTAFDYEFEERMTSEVKKELLMEIKQLHRQASLA